MSKAAGSSSDDAPTIAGLDRRSFLQTAGIAAGGLATLGVERLLAARTEGWDFQRTARALVESLSPVQRAEIMLPWDHPSRGVVAHVACMTDAPRVADTLTAEQQLLVHRLYETMTSPERRRRFGRLVGLEAGGLDPCAVLMYGDPFETKRDFQVTLSGAHLLIRGGGMTSGGSAFGGPLGYGHQVGNGAPRLPGNAFAYHGDALNTFLATLPAAARGRALVAGEPISETAVQLQGAGGHFPGLAARALDDEGRAGVSSLVDVVLSCYDEKEREAAWGCIRRNGGVEALHLTVWRERGFYADGAAFADLTPAEATTRGEPYWHVWRIEGPGTALHFRGWPHVHASIHLADDGGANQHVGDVLGTASRLVGEDELRPMLRAALRDATGESLAFVEAVPARFVPGPITTSVIWNLDPFDFEVGVLVIRGDAMGTPVRAAVEDQGERVDGSRIYRLAMRGLFAGEEEIFGKPEDVEATGLQTRDVYEAWFRRLGGRLGGNLG